jgi:NitT/TauT family transport system substrate-binding protein
MPKSIRHQLRIVVAVAALILAVGCGSDDSGSGDGSGSGDTQDVSLRLDWVATWYHAPFYLASDRGYYKDAGLNVAIGDGKGSSTTGELVSNGAETFGFMSIPTAMIAVSKGASLEVLGGYIQRSPETVLALGSSGISSPADLAGKTWGYTAGSSGETLFPAFASETGVDESSIEKKTMPASAKTAALLTGQVDFITDWAPTVVPAIEANGEDAVAIAYSDYIDLLGHGFVATPSTIEDDPDMVRAFMEATVKGINDAVEDPEAAVDALIKHRPALADSRDTLVSQMKDLSTYLHTDASEGHPTLWVAPEDMESTADLSSQYLGLTDDVDLDTFYTNEFVEEK